MATSDDSSRGAAKGGEPGCSRAPPTALTDAHSAMLTC